MLNIPESVKTLFKTDGTHKNFRVQFPNGEFPDITNENIVRESLHFTESLCSQSVFRFGLAEASVLEFETVGIGNMYGMTINASIEIDLSSLSVSEIADIEAGTWDGQYVALADSDLGFPFFRVPLGVFRIEKCPRNHGAMTHRQVEAYSVGAADFTSPFEEAKLHSNGTLNAKYQPNVHRLIYASLGWANESALSGFSKTVVDTWENFPAETRQSGGSGPSSDSGYKLDHTATVFYKALKFGSNIAADNLYQLACDTHFDTVLESVSAYLDTISTMTSGVKTAIIDGSKILTVISAGSSLYQRTFRTDKAIPVFYPKYAGEYCVFVPTRLDLVIREVNIQTSAVRRTYTESFRDLVTSPNLYRFTDNFGNLSISVSPTGTSDDGAFSTFIDSYDLQKLLPSYLEVSAEFGKSDRYGGIEMLRLTASPYTSISPGDYEECWWDEYDVDEIGTVTISYKANKNQEETADITISNGQSIYDMTTNELLKNIANTTFSAIKSIITSDFKPYARTVEFTPVELSMQGWPWLEAGDALKITAEDGTVVRTYALRVEMSGIQHLMATITAEGGEIVGEA